jgi:hypothetical protein
LVWVFIVDDRVTSQDDSHDLAGSNSLRPTRPTLETVVMIGIDVIAVLDHVVLEHTVVTEAAEAVAGKVLNRIVFYQ